MAKIKFLKQPGVKKVSDWALVGKVWPHKTKKDAFSGRFGIKQKNEAGELIDIFSSIEVKSDDPIMIRPNLRQREGKQDPTYLMYMLKESTK